MQISMESRYFSPSLVIVHVTFHYVDRKEKFYFIREAIVAIRSEIFYNCRYCKLRSMAVELKFLAAPDLHSAKSSLKKGKSGGIFWILDSGYGN